jgi:glucan 1,3-beta-glucosidase
VGYWNVIDILDGEPYVAGAYPYLIRAIYWAAEFGIKATIDLHGVPGSQNGQDNSGLSNIVSFQANQTNFDRAVAAIRNLTEEFSKSVYNGTVTSEHTVAFATCLCLSYHFSAIELMNEPRISDANFTMSELKAFYSTASRAVRQYSQNSLRVLIHDAFWGPGYWSGFDPLENTTSTSPQWLDIDLHNYFAFAPNNNLPQDVILEKVCNTSQYLRNTASLSPVLVGEWSLETGTAPNASPLGRAAQSQARRTWFRKLFEAQLAAYSAYGWYFWTWKTECECLGRIFSQLLTTGFR